MLEAACWDQVPHCTDGKTEGLAGEGLAQGVWRSANDVGRCLEWISRGETAAAEGLRGAVPPRDQWGLQTGSAAWGPVQVG